MSPPSSVQLFFSGAGVVMFDPCRCPGSPGPYHHHSPFPLRTLEGLVGYILLPLSSLEIQEVWGSGSVALLLAPGSWPGWTKGLGSPGGNQRHLEG